MFQNIPTEQIALIVSGVALVGTVCSAALSPNGISRTNYLNAVTANRVDWIAEVRNDFSKLMLETVRNVQTIGPNKYASIDEITYLTMNLNLKLNPNSKIDARLMKLLASQLIAFKSGDSVLLSDIHTAIQTNLMTLLKNEWDKVKYEASGFFGKCLIKTKGIYRNQALENVELRKKLTQSVVQRSDQASIT